MDLTEPPLSIVHLLAPARFGGLETVVTALAPGLAAAGQRVTVGLVLSPEESGSHPVAEALSEGGVDVETLAISGRDYLGERRRVRELLAGCEADVLHTHGYRPDVIDAPVARRMDVRTVTTVHGFMGGGVRDRIYEWLQLRAFRRFDAVVAVSDRLSGELAGAGVDGGRVHAIPNAWASSTPMQARTEARERLGLPQEGHVVGWVGRMTPEKGADVMVSAAAHVPGDVLFSMIGDGPDRRACEEAAEALGVSARFRWHGVQAGAGSMLRAFDAVALTSWTEGTPMLLLEAMSAGVPIITTAVGGIPAVVGPAEASLCEAGDAEAIAQAITSVVRDPAAAARRAEAATRRLEVDFAIEPWVRRHLDLYHTLLRN